MIKKSTPINTIAFWVILIGGAFCLLIPMIAPMLPIQYLKGYGDIGSAIDLRPEN